MEQTDDFRWVADFTCDGDCAGCGRCSSTTPSISSTEAYLHPPQLPWTWRNRLACWLESKFVIPVEKWLHYHGIRKCDWLD